MHQVNKFFGIPAHHAEASDGHGEEMADGDDHADEGHDVAAADTDHSDEASHDEAAQGDDHAAAMHDDPDHAVIKAVHHGQAPKGAIFMHLDNHVMDEAHHAPKWVKVSPFIAMLIGFFMAYWFYIANPSLPRRLAESQRPLYLFLLNKWYFDEIFDAIIVRPLQSLARFLVEARGWRCH